MKRSDFINLEGHQVKKSDIVSFWQNREGTMVWFRTTEPDSEYSFTGTISEFEVLIFDEDPLKEVLIRESAKVSNTCQQIIKEIQKIKEHMPAVENYEEGNYLKDWVREVQLAERHGIVKGIEWANSNPADSYKEAISRIKNGGPL